MRTRPRLLRRTLLALLVLGLVGAATGGVYGAFFATTTNPASPLSAQRIFSGDRTTSFWGVADAAGGGAAVNKSDPIAFQDSLSKTTKNWATSWSATRYLEFDYVPSRPAGLAVSDATFHFRYRPSTSDDNVCFYLELRSIATNAVVATYGSTGSPVACVTGASSTTVSTPIPAISTSDLANDLRVRVYMRNATAARSIVMDTATVTGTEYDAFTLYPALHVDRADGTVQTNPWSLAAADGTYLLTARWAAAYNANRWVEFDASGFVPAGATVTGASLTHTYKTNFNPATVCYYLETYSGGSLIGSHGSTSSDISCTSTAWQTDTIPLPEVNTAARANDLVLRIYAKSSAGGGRESQHDRVTVTFTYELD